MMKSKIFQILIKIAEWCGEIKSANMHSEDFMLVQGVTADGRNFTVSLSIHEKEEHNA